MQCYTLSADPHAGYGVRWRRVAALLRILLPTSAASEETWHGKKNKDVVHPHLFINISISCPYLSEKCFRNQCASCAQKQTWFNCLGLIILLNFTACKGHLCRHAIKTNLNFQNDASNEFGNGELSQKIMLKSNRHNSLHIPTCIIWL